MDWNEQQRLIFQDAATGKGDSVVVARAGTGKTTTIVHACTCFPRGCSTVYLAFNTRIKDEVSRKAPEGVEVRTLHSLGRGALYLFARSNGGRALPDPDEYKTRRSVENLWPDLFEAKRGRLVARSAQASARVGALIAAAAFAKNILARTIEDVEAIVYRLDLSIGVPPGEDYAPELRRFCSDVLILLDAEVARFRESLSYNFDDMIWLPVRMGLRVKQYDRVVIDEAQDLNPCQHAIAQSARRRGGRILMVGDDRQAIYAWRGADEGGMERFCEESRARVFYLPVTYRCGRAIVALAQKFVPDYKAAPSNPEGVVERRDSDFMLEHARPGDAILSRVNAPLLGLCLRLLQRGKRASVVGRDVGREITALLKSAEDAGAGTVPELVSWVEGWRVREVERLEAREPPGNTEPTLDRAACVLALCEGAESVADVGNRARNLFTDEGGREEIVLSSTHKAKGLEWSTVWMLEETYRPGRGSEEDNLYYVAVTRAIGRLVLVHKKTSSESASSPSTVVECLTAGDPVVCEASGSWRVE